MRNYELRRVASILSRCNDGAVAEGPFAGMRFKGRLQAAYLPQIIGSFEYELHPILNTLIKHEFPLIINIGAADGYYAVGFARNCENARIVAFEMDDNLRRASQILAEINNVADRIQCFGKCDSDSLRQYNLDSALVIIDCEGAEIDILTESLLPSLSKTWLLVELHDALRPGCGRILSRRFDATHDLCFISAKERDPEQFSLPTKLSRRQKIMALDERRLGTQEWVLMMPKPR
jgi:predicted O-methyltransferase YrrM